MGTIMKNIKELLKNGEYDQSVFSSNPEKYKEVNTSRKYFVKDDFNYDDFFKLFIYSTGITIYPTGTKFIVDDANRPVIEQLFYYLINDSDNFNGDLYKGIWLCGPYGTGKTVIMTAFTECMKVFLHETREQTSYNESRLSKIGVNRLRAMDILKESNNFSGRSFVYKNTDPVFIDDVGKEQYEVNEFGTKTKLWENVVVYRYDHKLLTFATSNYKMTEAHYSGHCKDRMKSMFNEIILKGAGKRK